MRKTDTKRAMSGRALAARFAWFPLVFWCALELTSVAAGEPAGLQISAAAGLFGEPFTVSLTRPSVDEVYYSTNGAVPGPETARRWPGSLEVRTTTVLRVAAYAEGARVSPVLTRTYLFPGQVLKQTGKGFPDHWGETNRHPVMADYEMDPEIVNDRRYRDLLEPALRSIPSLSIAIRQEDLFDVKRGIYANPLESGIPWERAASVELIYPDGRPGFQADCGLRIQGGWNRRPEESPKHAFRLVFHKRYGPARLVFPIFGSSGGGEFETLILRAGCNNTWLHWSGEERHRGDYLRDQWMRDTYGAMGHPSARGCFVHLYLNGLYWGMYNLVERPSAAFAAAHFGGSPGNYDARNGNNILEGNEVAWKRLFQLANASPIDEAKYAAIADLLDLPAFADYILLNLYGANGDWDGASNWYAARSRRPPGKFRFFVWDGERTLEGPEASILDTDSDESPMRLFQRLRQSESFRKLFAERVREQVAPGGPLDAASAASRFQKLASEIELAIVAESARWGDYRRDVHRYKVGPYELYTRDDQWRPEIQRLLNDYFPRRTSELLKQLRPAGLCPPGP